MSDTRVEEKREELRLMEQRLQDKRVETKRQENSLSFSRVVASMQQTSKETDTRQKDNKETQSRVSERLVARRGINSNQFSQKLLGEGAQRGKSRREALLRTEGEMGAKRQGLKQVADAQMQERAAKTSMRNDAAGSQDTRKDKKHGSQETQEGREARREAVIAGAGNTATLQALLGVSPKQSSGGATGVHADVQQMINEIVEAVHRGVDKNNFGFMHIELKSHVLSGSSLSLQNSREGVSLKVNTPDEQVARLLSSGSTAQDLSNALKQKGVTLRSLEVNEQKVIR